VVARLQVSLYCKRNGKEYLQYILSTTLNKVLSLVRQPLKLISLVRSEHMWGWQGFSVEVDPLRLEEGKKIGANQKLLKRTCKFL